MGPVTDGQSIKIIMGMRLAIIGISVKLDAFLNQAPMMSYTILVPAWVDFFVLWRKKMCGNV